MFALPINPRKISHNLFPFGKGDSVSYLCKLTGWARSQMYRNLAQVKVTGLITLRYLHIANEVHINKLARPHITIPITGFRLTFNRDPIFFSDCLNVQLRNMNHNFCFYFYLCFYEFENLFDLFPHHSSTLWQLCAAMMSWVGCLLKDSELFILFAENS